MGSEDRGRPESEQKSRGRRGAVSPTMTVVGVLVVLAVVLLSLRFMLGRQPQYCGPAVPDPDSLYFAGDTMRQYEVFTGMLVRMGVPWDLAGQAHNALAETDFNFRRLKPGDSVSLVYRGLNLAAISYHKDMMTSYEVRFSLPVAGSTAFHVDSAGPVAEKIIQPVDTVRTALSGTVHESFWNSLLSLGEQPWLAMRFTEILRYDVDFFTESNDGDSFQLVFDRLYVDSTFYRYGRVHAVHYRSRIHNTRGFFYQDPRGHWDFYNEKGQSLRKTVLRSPLEFKKVTSHFGMRFHPIRKIRCKHNGVDYAAPSGTPVSCVADGVVTISRWVGGYGRLVEVKHKGGLSSRYGHLRGYGPGVKQGRRVRQSQTIGYVGSTGMSTGPHLHFEIRKNGNPVNPLKVIPPRADPVLKKYRDEFDRVKAELGAELERATEMARSPEIAATDSGAAADSGTAGN